MSIEPGLVALFAAIYLIGFISGRITNYWGWEKRRDGNGDVYLLVRPLPRPVDQV